jgi:hypothetical protein
LREIARCTYTSKSAIAPRAAELDALLNELERQALGTLEESFILDDLCEALG